MNYSLLFLNISIPTKLSLKLTENYLYISLRLTKSYHKRLLLEMIKILKYKEAANDRTFVDGLSAIYQFLNFYLVEEILIQ